MDTKKEIKKHELCIEILEGISHFQNSIKLKKDSITGIAGTFPELRSKYLDNIDTYKRCIKRLEQRYNKILNEN
jgi:hypothetical protein